MVWPAFNNVRVCIFIPNFWALLVSPFQLARLGVCEVGEHMVDGGVYKLFRLCRPALHDYSLDLVQVQVLGVFIRFLFLRRRDRGCLLLLVGTGRSRAVVILLALGAESETAGGAFAQGVLLLDL